MSVRDAMRSVQRYCLRFFDPLRGVVLAAIVAYQRYVSPHKGFCCAYRIHTGRQSCSVLGFRAVRRYGVLMGMAVLRHRLHLCGVAHRRYATQPRRAFHGQQGFCDVGCDLPCDVPSVDGCFSGADCLSACDCGGCDWPNRKKDDKEQYVYIPPNVGGDKR